MSFNFLSSLEKTSVKFLATAPAVKSAHMANTQWRPVQPYLEAMLFLWMYFGKYETFKHSVWDIVLNIENRAFIWHQLPSWVKVIAEKKWHKWCSKCVGCNCIPQFWTRTISYSATCTRKKPESPLPTWDCGKGLGYGTSIWKTIIYIQNFRTLFNSELLVK